MMTCPASKNVIDEMHADIRRIKDGSGLLYKIHVGNYFVYS